MADAVPQALKGADINLYKAATRGSQLQTVKPIIAYWCEYWVVNQILAKNLHSSDADILNYTTGLMDKLEQTKKEYPNEDAITDDTAAQAYVEQFAQETLDRAERVIKANKVTLQTASTFDAALTFFNLVNIWGPPDNETQQKIKYAKWNAARITKAIKEGKDPNETNPKKEDLPAQQQPPPPLDPSDPEVHNLASPSPSATVPKPATVEDAPDADIGRDSRGVSLPQSPDTAPGPPSVPEDDELRLPSAPGYGEGAAAPAPQPGYFDPPPDLPSPLSPPAQDELRDTPGLDAPSAPAGWSQAAPPAVPPLSPPTGPSAPPAKPTTTFSTPPHPPSRAIAPSPVSPPPTSASINTTTPADVSRPVAPPSTNPAGSNAASAAAAGAFSQVPQQVTGNFVTDDMAMAQAQKHARWAISALNFEDVPTAVRELRRALESLGAT